jgi:magnesium chelatase subunit I
MNITKINTLGDLKKSGYQSRSIKDELRENLISKMMSKETVFKGVHGYENTVIPELERAILSRHNINLLGLRGQAKTRLARLMINLLDEYIPVVQGSEINDDPLNPISRFAIETIREKGDETPIYWLHRQERFAEKLATPDVTVADIIGDVDPIKAANLKLSYADDRVIHYGMIPRANRCIFVINELPDLQARIQVALFNILQEGDIQIRGFKLRLPLDMQFIFTANPEDIETAKIITQQEAKSIQKDFIQVPELAKDLLEQIVFEARESEYIDAKSGVSARLSISAFENLLSTAERRSILAGDDETMIRLNDFDGIIPSITGKVELVYEGEQEGAQVVAENLIKKAIKSLFPTYFPEIKKLEKATEESPYDDIVSWFFNTDQDFELLDDYSEKAYILELDKITPLNNFLSKYQPNMNLDDAYFVKEFLLWGLVEFKKLSKYRFAEGTQFKDPYGNFMDGL